MNYELRRTNRKTLAISIVDGKVIVRSPLNLKKSSIDAFVKSKEAWIKRKLEKYSPMGINLEENQAFLIFGNEKKFEIIESSRFKIEDFTIFKPKNMPYEILNKKVEDSFKQELHDYIKIKVHETAQLLEIPIPPFKIRRYKRIYGRCNSKGELAFNLFLFHKPLAFIDYVVLHECVHILEFNHSKNFYNIIEKHMPNYKKIMKL